MQIIQCIECYKVNYGNCWSHANLQLVQKVQKDNIKVVKGICPRCKKTNLYNLIMEE